MWATAYLIKLKCVLSCYSHVWLFATPWTVAHQAPLSMGVSRQEYWSGLPRPSPGNLLTQGPNPSLMRFLRCRQILYHWATRAVLIKLRGNQKASLRKMAFKLLTFSERKEGTICSQDASGMRVHFFLHRWFNHFKQFWKKLYIVPFSALKQKGVRAAAVVLKKKKKKSDYLIPDNPDKNKMDRCLKQQGSCIGGSLISSDIYNIFPLKND